jgi:hypothetical protein
MTKSEGAPRVTAREFWKEWSWHQPAPELPITDAIKNIAIKFAEAYAQASESAQRDQKLAACLGIKYCEDLVDDGTPWEVPAEPEPQYFETLEEALTFYCELGMPLPETPTEEKKP